MFYDFLFPVNLPMSFLSAYQGQRYSSTLALYREMAVDTCCISTNISSVTSFHILLVSVLSEGRSSSETSSSKTICIQRRLVQIFVCKQRSKLAPAISASKNFVYQSIVVSLK